MERPQPDGAGFGYTSSIEAIVSSARCVTGDARVISKALQGVIPSRADKCRSGSDRETSHQPIDDTRGYLRTASWLCEVLRSAQDDSR